MKRLYIIVILLSLGILWAAYTWVPQVRAAIDGAAAPVGAAVGNALYSTYKTVVTSPFWQTWIKPSLNSFLIGFGLMGIIALMFWRFKPVDRFRHAPTIIRQTQPEYTAPQVIPETPKTVIKETPPATTEKTEAEQ